MPKFRKIPVEIEAHQWFRNGDHPKDEQYEVKIEGKEPFLSEGKIVRYFRRPEPEYDGQRKCEQCGEIMHIHGWIDTFSMKEGGDTVCPSDWIITDSLGNFYPCKPDIFELTYESAPEKSNAVR